MCMFRDIYVSFTDKIKGTDASQLSQETFIYPTKFRMPKEDYDSRLADVTSSLYKALFNKIENKVSVTWLYLSRYIQIQGTKYAATAQAVI